MIVIKLGGSVVEGLHSSILDDFAELHKTEKIVVVHGGGRMLQMLPPKWARNKNS